MRLSLEEIEKLHNIIDRDFASLQEQNDCDAIIVKLYRQEGSKESIKRAEHIDRLVKEMQEVLDAK